eukprot:scaffold1362_cov125-Cylindrotheca_fusiformis.AAC.1
MVKSSSLRYCRFVCLWFLTATATAFISSSSSRNKSQKPPFRQPWVHRSFHRSVVSPSMALQSSSRRDNGDGGTGRSSRTANENSILERIVISGVSVSSKGFHVLFQTTRGILPLPITRDIQDSYCATSPESLTILQLLSHVDMAGAVLPPEMLAKLAIYHSEKNKENEKNTSGQLAQYIQRALPKECSSYKDAHPWYQSRIPLPQITLDQVTLTYDAQTEECQCQLECALPKDVLSDDSSSSSLSFPVTGDLVEPLSFQYHPETSPTFTSLALALRYKAPIVLHQTTTTNTGQEYGFPRSRLDREFPKRTSVKQLQQQSSQVSATLTKGFEINKLTGALAIAERLGDTDAMERIQAKLDEYENSIDQLPTTTPPSTTASSNNNSNTDGGISDDPDQNILQ